MPSSAFLIGAVGASLFGSKRFGIILYAAHALSCVAIGFAGRFYFSGKKKEYFAKDISQNEKRAGCASAFVEAVTSSATSMLFICAFVVFFSSFTGILKALTSGIALDEGAKAVMLGFFEMTGGVFATSGLPLRAAIPIAAAITGWSGLSVHFQLIGICGAHRMSLMPYFISKVASAVVCAALVWIMTGIFAGRLNFSVGGSIESLLVIGYDPSAFVTLAIFAFSCLKLFSRIKK